RQGRSVAVKFMLAHDPSERARLRFGDEANKIASVESPHVVRVYDVGDQDGAHPYIVMELLEGETLREHLRRTTVPSLDAVIRLVAELSAGLRTIHREGIVHRDLKPGNVFLVGDGPHPKAKIVDFGLAKWLDDGSSITRRGARLGTPYYMSREQVVDPASVDHRADLWSLSVVAYQMLTGEKPFDGVDADAVLDAIIAGAPTPPSAVRPGLTDEVDVFFWRAFHRELDQRHPTANDLAAAFGRAMTTVNRLSADVWPVGGPGRHDAPVSGPVADTELVEPLGLTRLDEPTEDVVG
ncbi:MAG: serine/threonine-protein kinase, partial [Myxococcota bacterium]